MCPAVIQMYLKSVLREMVKLFEGKRKKHDLGSRRRQKCLLIALCPCGEAGCSYWGGVFETKRSGNGCVSGTSWNGVPSVVLGPGQGSCWKDRFPFSYLWDPWRWAVWDTLAECWSTDTFNFTRKPSRCLENGWEWAWWPHDEAANRSPLRES